MQCDICFRTGGQKLPFLCSTDARNQLYESRVQHAHVLLEKDALDRQITALLTSQSEVTEHINNETAVSRQYVDRIIVEKEQAKDRTQQIIAHADELRAKVEKAREEIVRRRATISRRKSERELASNGLEGRRARQNDEVEKSIRMTKYKWNQIHAITASSRVFLCGEAAKLYGLRRVRRNGGLEEYRIGGIGIIDLRSMNTASPAQISTALSHVVHLLILSTHYLAIRLPAEITLPHRDYPLPTIFPPLSSHKHANVPFPGTIQGQPSNSPSASSYEQPKYPRPRPLFITKPLPMLAAEDAAGYGLFIEGVTLLAYDIAWLCKSQGIPVGDSGSFEDVCNIGKNMFNLLIDSQSRRPRSRVSSTRTTPTKGGREESEAEGEQVTSSLMGFYSHGTAHSFLGNHEGTEFTRSFKIISPMKLADKLKARLASEVANAEWEVLDQDAWAVDDELRDDGIVVGARREGEGEGEGRRGYGMQSFMSMKTVMDAVEVMGGGGERRGTSGWTKLKPR